MNYPKIRFNGFTDEWEKCKLGDLSDSFEYGLNAAAKNYDGKNKYLRITDIDEDNHLFKKNGLTSPDIDLSDAENYKLKVNDILFARTGASVGKTYRYDIRDGLVYYAGFLIRARINKEFDAEFIYQNTLTKNYNQYIQVTSQRSGQPGVNAQEYSKFELSVPYLEEQQKIGQFFKKIDEIIILHQRKLELLKEQKKGFLQKMFPKTGQTAPEIRFKGFTDDWEQHKLGDKSERVAVGFVGTIDKFYIEKEFGVPMYRTGNLNGERLNINNLKYVTTEFHNKNKKSQLKFGDILIARHGENGKAVIYSSYEEANCLNIVIIRPKFIDIDSYFLMNYINSPSISNKIQSLSAGSTQNVINTKEIERLFLHFPSKAEQQKIGQLFKQLDDTITLHQRKLEKLKESKQAFLQKMFV